MAKATTLRVRPHASAFVATITALIGAGLGACTDPAPDPCAAMLAEGELVISEIMTDAPKGREWIEIYNASERDIPIEGLVVAYARERGSSGNSHRIEGAGATLPPGAFFTIGMVQDEARPPYVNYGLGDALGTSGLTNSRGILQLQCGGTLVDEVEYGWEEDGQPVEPRGASFNLNGEFTPDAATNDERTSWCLTLEQELFTYDPNLPDNRGTPGSPNPPCGGENVDPGNTCVIADGEAAGTLRDIVPAQAGDLIITEFMSDPGGPESTVEAKDGEWFELYVARDVDLNGLWLGSTGLRDDMIKDDAELSDGLDEDEVFLLLSDADADLNEKECLPAAAGSYLLFARKDDPLINGGLPAPDYTFSFDILNSDSTLFLGRLNKNGGLDALELVTYEDVGEGASWAMSPSALDESAPDPKSNNVPESWCLATDEYGPGGRGSPGAANPACVGGPSGDTCLDGEELREQRPPTAGSLVISELMPNPSGTDSDREWIELTATQDVDLTGLEIGRDEEIKLTIGAGEPDCFPVAAGERVLLAKQTDEAINGGLPAPDFEMGNDLTLLNSGGDLFLRYRGELVDAMSYSGSTDGAAWQLSADALSAEANDDEASWCDAIAPYGEGDLGTPRAENTLCGEEPPEPPMGQCDDDGVPRDPVPPGPGDLVINEFMANPDAVTDSNGEWLELRVEAEFDLNGLKLTKSADALVDGDELTDDACLHVTPGQILLFTAKDADNGGLPAADFSLPITLNNSDSGIYIGHGEAVIDELTYSSSQGAGVAASLDPSAGAADNDDADAAPWCDATAPYGDGDLGTPGQENPACG